MKDIDKEIKDIINNMSPENIKKNIELIKKDNKLLSILQKMPVDIFKKTILPKLSYTDLVRLRVVVPEIITKDVIDNHYNSILNKFPPEIAEKIIFDPSLSYKDIVRLKAVLPNLNIPKKIKDKLNFIKNFEEIFLLPITIYYSLVKDYEESKYYEESKDDPDVFNALFERTQQYKEDMTEEKISEYKEVLKDAIDLYLVDNEGILHLESDDEDEIAEYEPNQLSLGIYDAIYDAGLTGNYELYKFFKLNNSDSNINENVASAKKYTRQLIEHKNEESKKWENYKIIEDEDAGFLDYFIEAESPVSFIETYTRNNKKYIVITISGEGNGEIFIFRSI